MTSRPIDDFDASGSLRGGGMKDRRRKVLIVDDDKEIAKLVSVLLATEGYETSEAMTGGEALRKVAAEQPELVLLDLQLPDLSGEKVLEKIKKDHEDTGVVIITGFGGERVAVELMRAGAIDFISKPLDREMLLSTVRNALKIRDDRVEERRHLGYSSLEKFFPYLAHEVRNPLHAIGGAVAVIQRRSNPDDPILAQSIRIIQEEVRHLSEFVQDCLDFVRPPVVTRYELIDLREVIEAVMNLVSYMFDHLSKKIEVTMDVDPVLPRVMANYEEIKQAFLNIVRNAFEAMQDGGMLRIWASRNPGADSEWIKIVFSDTGGGIRKDDERNLFNPFFTTKTRGTGLGLALAKRIIEDRHRGKIRLESEEGKGTSVIIELPAKVGERGG